MLFLFSGKTNKKHFKMSFTEIFTQNAKRYKTYFTYLAVALEELAVWQTAQTRPRLLVSVWSGCTLFAYFLRGMNVLSWEVILSKLSLLQEMKKIRYSNFSTWKLCLYMCIVCFNAYVVIKIQFHLFRVSIVYEAGLGGSVGYAVRLETRRSRVQPPPRSATFFRGDWSWNIFYGHSLPSADTRRAVVSFWRKNVHNTG